MSTATKRNPTNHIVIPSAVRFHPKLVDGARLLYGEIDGMLDADGKCRVDNQEFADLYRVTPVTVSSWLAQLNAAGFIHVTNEKGHRAIALKKTISPHKENLNAGSVSLDYQADEIFKLYPRQERKYEATPYIQTAISIAGYDELIRKLHLFSDCVSKWPDEEKRYVPSPVEWFRNHRWEDDPKTWDKSEGEDDESPYRQPPDDWREKLAKLAPMGEQHISTWWEVPPWLQKQIREMK